MINIIPKFCQNLSGAKSDSIIRKKSLSLSSSHHYSFELRWKMQIMLYSFAKFRSNLSKHSLFGHSWTLAGILRIKTFLPRHLNCKVSKVFKKYLKISRLVSKTFCLQFLPEPLSCAWRPNWTLKIWTTFPGLKRTSRTSPLIWKD